MNPEVRRCCAWCRLDEDPKTVQLLEAENRTLVARPAGCGNRELLCVKCLVLKRAEFWRVLYTVPVESNTAPLAPAVQRGDHVLNVLTTRKNLKAQRKGCLLSIFKN